MKLHFSLQAVAIITLVLLAGEVNAKPVKHSFTQIADTNGNFSNFGIPVINNLGIVGFSAQLDGGGKGVFSSNGTITTTIANTNRNFRYLDDDTSINDAGTMAFIGFLQNQPNPQTVGVYTSNGRTLKPIITTPITDENGEGFRANSFREVSINNAGTVALIESFSGRANGVFTSDGNTTKEIVGSAPPFLSGVQINDVGTVVYNYYIFGIYTGDSSTTPPIATASGSSDGKVNFVGSPSLNNVGTFAYVSGVADEAKTSIIESKVLLKRGDKTITIADTNVEFSSFGNTSINDRGKVAFIANLDSGGEGIYTGKNPKTDKVIATGDSLFGYTIVDLDFSPEGLNNFGQITFVAKLANNTQVVARTNLK